MNNLSTVNATDITSQIGALELGDHLECYGDSALEAAGANVAPATYPIPMCISQGGVCQR